LSKAFNLLTNRQLIAENAVGVYSRGRFKDRDAILDKGSRLLFITPWHNRSLIGTAHLPYPADPDDFQVTGAEIQDFISEINDACPAARIAMKDIERVYGGLLPADADKNGVQLLREHQLYDHRKDDHIDGFLSVKGVKFTEARYVAEETVNAVFRKLGCTPPKSQTTVTPIYGGQIEHFEKFVCQETRLRRELSADVVRTLIMQYGSAYREIFKYLQNPNEVGDTNLGLTRAEVIHSIREEMAQKLADVVSRRTTLALPGRLTEKSLSICASVMAQELAWNEERMRREIAQVQASSGGGTILGAEAA
jgi:glycerol-3-phosphate dehydrogenase